MAHRDFGATSACQRLGPAGKSAGKITSATKVGSGGKRWNAFASGSSPTSELSQERQDPDGTLPFNRVQADRVRVRSWLGLPRRQHHRGAPHGEFLLPGLQHRHLAVTSLAARAPAEG